MDDYCTQGNSFYVLIVYGNCETWRVVENKLNKKLEERKMPSDS